MLHPSIRTSNLGLKYYWYYKINSKNKGIEVKSFEGLWKETKKLNMIKKIKTKSSVGCDRQEEMGNKEKK